MSERYIFNKKLNRTNPILYWLFGSAVLLFTWSAIGQESQVALVDPEAKAAEMYTSTLTDIQFKRLANGAARDYAKPVPSSSSRLREGHLAACCEKHRWQVWWGPGWLP